MATTQNTYTGNGSTVLYSFTFPYLENTAIKVSLNGVITTAYTLANATTIQFTTAPANGAAIRIFRVTDDATLAATFYPGSSIRSQDLNENFTQNLYVTQESNRDATTATSTAEGAVTTANTALSNSTAATSTANTASTNASAAVATANTASSNASSAVSTANTASTNASTALSTANTAATNAATALSTANTALSTANSASSNATTAVATSNTASTNSSSAVSTANTASTNASSAVTTANTASTNASTALSTANTAIGTANAAASAVANAILYDTVANVAAIPASPVNNDAVEVTNSTGIQSFTPLSGIPAGFVGDSGLSVRMVYTTSGATWNWIQYFPNDPETRYGDAITTLQTDLNTAETDILALDSSKLSATTAASTYLTQANASSTYLTQTNAASTYQSQSGMSSYLTTSAAGSTYAPLASPTFTGTVTIPAGASISGYLDTTTASTTYQTQAGMSGYLATGTIGTSVQGYDADTAKTDIAQSFTAAQRGEITTLTDAATIAVDFAVANNYSVELAGNRTLGNPTNQVAGQSGSLFVVQDGTGSRTLAYSSDWEFAGGTAPTLSTAASAVDRIDYIVRASGNIHAVFTAAYS
jgi:hypothetical protein